MQSQFPKKSIEDIAISMQSRLIGPRYSGATLANIKAPERCIEKIHNFFEKPKNMLVFLGNPGIGKTYFCAALVPWMLTRFNTYRYWHEDTIYKKLRERISEGIGDYIEELRYMIDDEFVMIDDVGCNRPNEWREEVLFELLNIRYNLTYPTVITSNLTSKDFKEKYHYRIASRLFASENVVIEMHDGEDLRQQGL